MRLKAILALYARPLDGQRPVVCFDEQMVQLIADKRPTQALQAGRPGRRDYEYVRHGTRNLFIFVEPQRGYRQVLVTHRRTKIDCAKAMRYLVEVVYPSATQIDVVCDNLNTHTAACLYEVFGRAEAERLLQRLVFHYTPCHASWLNIAEIELSVLTRQCLTRRIASDWDLWLEVLAWENTRNLAQKPIAWSFDWPRAKRVLRNPRGNTTGQN